MSSLLVKGFHGVAVATTVPFGLIAIFAPNPEKVKFDSRSVSLPLPTPLLHIFGTFCHLTMVCHECICGYFVFASLRDHGIIPAKPPSLGVSEKSVGQEDLFFSSLHVASLFVLVVFWSAMVVDPLLFIDPEMMKFPHDAPRSVLYKTLFRMLWSPASGEEVAFFHFMRYIHTWSTLLVTVEAAMVEHPLADWASEASTLVSYCSKYLAWNLFTWWLLRHPPYPWQLQFWNKGMAQGLLAHGLCFVWAFALLTYSRAWRGSGGTFLGRVLLSVPLVIFVWASHGGFPMKSVLARYHGAELKP